VQTVPHDHMIAQILKFLIPKILAKLKQRCEMQVGWLKLATFDK